MSDPKPPKKVFLSASRIDTFQTCSQLYAAKYVWKLPDTGNDGSRRGSTVHDVLEILLEPARKPLYIDALINDTCRNTPELWEMVLKFAKQYKVDDEANLKLIDSFIITGLKNEFFGPPGTFEIMAELPFELTIDRGDGRRWAARGFIDKLFKVKDELGVRLVTRDYKSSKSKHEGSKLEFNVQSLIYQLAERELFPDIKRREFDFLFLKFPKKPRQAQPSFTDEQLNGFEWVLSELQTAMEQFTLDNGLDNVAYDSAENEWLCGREGVKKDGSKAWICDARLPKDYWVIVNVDGSILSSANTKQELTPKEGEKVEKRQYPGCPVFFDQQTGKRLR
jgi:hypothetical protein